jgi:hypothetical protein
MHRTRAEGGKLERHQERDDDSWHCNDFELVANGTDEAMGTGTA